MIKVSSPQKKKNTLFIWPEGIIPDTYQDEFYLEAYKNAVEKGVEIKILVVNWIGENAYFYRNDLPINI